jgi:hypothetical protein
LECLARFRQVLTSQHIKGETLAEHRRARFKETLRVGLLAVVEPVDLLIEVAIKMERFDGHVGAFQGALQQAPEVLHAVGVDLSFRVRLGMIDDIVDVVGRQPVVGLQFVGVDARSRLNVFTERDWAANGGWVAYEDTGDLLVGRDGAGPFYFLKTPAVESYPSFSPDGNWITYVSNEGGRRQVYVRPFAGKPAGPTGKLQVSHNGGVQAVWGPVGRELFYLSDDGSVFAADTRNLGKAETLPRPVRLFRSCLTTDVQLQAGGPWFDARDGDKFLMPCRVGSPGRFTVLMNWAAPTNPR